MKRIRFMLLQEEDMPMERLLHGQIMIYINGGFL